MRNGRQRVASWILLAVTLSWLVPPPSARADFSAEPPIDWEKVAQYRIVPGDELRLDFGFNPLEGRSEFMEQKVRPDGRISVFPVGDVIAAGRTVTELDSVVTSALGTKLREPSVTITLTKLAAAQVHVIGRVTKPGSYQIEGQMSVIQAITAAGGFSDDAARNSVLVFHREGASDVKVARAEVDRMLKGAHLEGDVQLSRFDIVYVPRSTIGNINVFARQFFGEQGQIFSTILLGWQLFNLDRVFVVTSTH